MKALTEVAYFLKTHWVHILLIPPAALAITILHEAAHGALAIVQGGTITEFVWLPTAEEWGHIKYIFQKGSSHSAVAISIAPYFLWVTCCLLALALAMPTKPRPFWASSTIFIWLFLAPLADIANAALPYARGEKNDFYSAFGEPDGLLRATILGAAALSATVGYFLQRRLYAQNALGVPAYSLLGILAIVLMLVLQGRGLLGTF